MVGSWANFVTKCYDKTVLWVDGQILWKECYDETAW